MSSSLYSNLAALTGLLIWYGVFARLAPKDRTRWLRPLLPILLGFISFRVLGLYLSTVHPRFVPHLGFLTSGSTLLRFNLDVGLREETIKLLLALPILLWHTRPSAPSATQTSAHLAAALVGIGFATAENRLFFHAHAEPTLLVGRIFATTLLHATATGLCGAALVRAWQGKGHAWARFAVTLLLVAAAHGLYDWAPASGQSWLHLGGTSWLSLAVVIALTATFLHHHRHTQPPGTHGPSAQNWLLGGALLQYTLALSLTWAHWKTPTALWICTQECALFLPVIIATALGLAAVSPSALPSSPSHHE